MPNWGKLLSAFAEGGNPEAFARVRAQNEEKINNAQRRSLLESAEGRAQAGEGREAAKFNEWQGGAETRKKMDLAGLTKAEQDAIAATFTAGNLKNVESRAARAADREDEGLKLQREQLGISRQQLANEARRLNMTEAEYLQRKKAGDQEFEFNEKVNPYRLASAENAADPRQKYSSDLNALSSIYNAAVRNGDKETAAAMKERIDRMTAQQEAETIAWNERRNSRINPRGKAEPDGASPAWKSGVSGREWDPKAAPKVIKPNRK